MEVVSAASMLVWCEPEPYPLVTKGPICYRLILIEHQQQRFRLTAGRWMATDRTTLTKCFFRKQQGVNKQLVRTCSTCSKYFNEKLILSRVMIYSNSTKQAFHIFAIAKIFNNIKVDRILTSAYSYIQYSYSYRRASSAH